MALMEIGSHERGVSRKGLLESFSASVALDIIYVLMVRTYSFSERPYPETKKTVDRMLRRSSVELSQGDSDQERVRKSVAAMAKYRKAR